MIAPEHGRRPTATMADSPGFHQSRPCSSPAPALGVAPGGSGLVFVVMMVVMA